MVERVLSMHEVGGSIPSLSILTFVMSLPSLYATPLNLLLPVFLQNFT